MRWAGIDEAGYGPNLGPLVMSAVIAEGPDGCVPDVWGDLAATVSRAGGAPGGRIWVDDSKAILRAPRGRAHLETTCLALLGAAGVSAPGAPGLADLLAAVGAGTLDDAELTPWLGVAAEPPGRSHAPNPTAPPSAPFEGAPWRIVGVDAVVIGPARFNAALAASGSNSKAKVHFDAFARLLGALWERAGDGVVTRVHGDKHGGRHFYYDPLLGAFPGVRIDRGPEGPALSRYTLRDPARRLELSLKPRADADDGLVALASIVSKTVRERWMDCFNDYWTARIPGLRPTAGYPVDARRFRQAIEPDCSARGLDPALWWREK